MGYRERERNEETEPQKRRQRTGRPEGRFVVTTLFFLIPLLPSTPRGKLQGCRGTFGISSNVVLLTS